MSWKGTPKRSFLRMPLMDHLGPELAKESTMLGKVISGEIEGVTLPDFVGVVAVRTVQDAFDTGGFGQWQPNAPKTEAWKQGSMPLIDTTQLRDSVQYATVPA